MTGTLVWVVCAVLVLAAGLRIRGRLRDQRPGEPEVDDDAVRRILEEGRLEMGERPEPLDQERIDEEERRFWEEYWDDAEPW
jgi:hypothetical protein